MEALAIQCPQLQSIGLRYCDGFSDSGVVSLVKHCAGLLNLSLRGCGNITESAVLPVIQSCPKLQNFSLNDCKQITDLSKLLHFTGEHYSVEYFRLKHIPMV